MPIRAQCGQCATAFDAPEKLAGKKVRCPKCGTVISVPSPEPDIDDPLASLFDDELLGDAAFDSGTDPLGVSEDLLSDPLARAGAAPTKVARKPAFTANSIGTLLKRHRLATTIAAVAAAVLILAIVAATILPDGSDSADLAPKEENSVPPPAVSDRPPATTSEPEPLALFSDAETISWSVEPDPAPPDKRLDPQPIWLQSNRFTTPHARFASRDSGKVVVCSVVSEGVPSRLNGPVNKVLASYDLAGGSDTRSVQLPEGDYQFLDVSPDGELALMALKDSRRREFSRLEVWSFESGSKSVEWKPFGANDRRHVEWAVFVDRQHVLTRGTTRELTLWKIPECQPVHTIAQVTRVLALSPTRKYIAVRHRNLMNSPMRVYEVLTGKACGELEGGFPGAVYSAAFRSDGQALVVVGEKEIVTWDLATGNRSGEASIILAAPGRYHGVHWLTDRYVLISGHHVYDLEQGGWYGSIVSRAIAGRSAVATVACGFPSPAPCSATICVSTK